jgi:hypothetical protein
VHHATFCRAVASFFCSTRAASILPSRPHITIAVARSDGQGRSFFSAAEGLSLTNASTERRAGLMLVPIYLGLCRAADLDKGQSLAGHDAWARRRERSAAQRVDWGGEDAANPWMALC